MMVLIIEYLLRDHIYIQEVGLKVSIIQMTYKIKYKI